MLQVPTHIPINRAEQCSESCKEPLKTCREHNEANLLCCFSPRKQTLHKEAKRRQGRKLQLYPLNGSEGQQLSSGTDVFMYKERRN